MRQLALVVAAACVAAFSVQVDGASLDLDTRTIPGLAPGTAIVSKTIRLAGLIEQGDADRLRKMLDRLRTPKQSEPLPGTPLATVELSSMGGDLYEGLKLGYMFREFGVPTIVRAGQQCLSACALAFLGGTQGIAPAQAAIPSRSLEIGGQVAFHNFYLTSLGELSARSKDAREGVALGFSVARGGAAAMVHYAAEMGVDMEFVARVMGQPPESWEYVDTDESFVNLRICPLGLEKAPSDPAVVATNVCNHATGGIGRASPMQARPLSAREARRRLLELVFEGAQAMSVRGPLSDQVGAVLASRDESLVEAVYAGLRGAGVPLIEILGTNYEVTGYNLGAFPVTCHVSFIRSEPAKYGVVLSSADGLLKPFQTAPPACPALFLFDGGDILNRRR